MRIDTEIDRVRVEIDGEEYAVAEKTIATAEALIDAAQRCEGKPQYRLWLAEIEVLLGTDAVRKLFHDGKRENIDRIQRIHAGVLEAFDHNAQAVLERQAQLQREALEPVTDFLRQLESALKADAKSGIRRAK